MKFSIRAYLGHDYTAVTIQLNIAKTCPCNIESFLSCKKKKKKKKKKIYIYIYIFAQNIDCGYTLEPPPRGSSSTHNLRFG